MWMWEAIFIYFIINLNDALQGLSSLGCRVDINCDLPKSDNMKDVVDLVSRLRNTCCHIGSGNRYTESGHNLSFCVDMNESGFNVIYGSLYFNMYWHGVIALNAGGNALTHLANQHGYTIIKPS